MLALENKSKLSVQPFWVSFNRQEVLKSSRGSSMSVQLSHRGLNMQNINLTRCVFVSHLEEMQSWTGLWILLGGV